MAESNESPGGGDVLSQSEVERLLAQVTQQEGGATVVQATTDGGDPGASHSNKDKVQPYDFRQPVFLSASELRRLRLRHEEFVRALSARLSIYMRLEFTVQLTKLQTVTYQKFTESLPNPTHLSLFKLEPLRGIGILAIAPRLGLTMVDRQLGGSAQAVTADHDFSEIEMALLDQAVQLVLGEWCNHWAGVQELRPTVLGHENNAQFLQTAPHDTVLLVITMEAKLGDCVEPIQIALPCSTLEPLVRKLGQVTDAEMPAQDALPVRLQWNRNFDEVPVPVTAIWDQLVLTAREVANLKVGDVLSLDLRCTRQVKLRLAGLSKFEGHLGTTAGKWAVALTGRSKLP
jgi:flagellar motor switch protein FliM